MNDRLDEIGILEHFTLAGCYEELNKVYRTAQKHLERDTVRASERIGVVDDLLKAEKVIVKDLKPHVEDIKERVLTFKEQICTTMAEQKTLAEWLKAKLTHLADSDAQSDDATKRQFRRARIERVLVDFLLRCGHYDIATRIAKQSNITDLSNVAFFAQGRVIEESLRNRQTKPCLEWCYENRSKLRRLKSCLELKLRQQNFIEMLRRNEKLRAIVYAKVHFSKLDKEGFEFVLPSMALLVIPPDTMIKRYRLLWSEGRWSELIGEFRAEMLRVHNFGRMSAFSAMLQCGISALKTPHCGASKNAFWKSRRPDDILETAADEAHKAVLDLNNECPVCMDEVRPLARELPFARVNHSKVRCAYSGEVLDDNNIPMCLPNGMVYSEQSLLAIASKNNGIVVCPRTKEQFTIQDAERVFIM